jgi:hypothetical protein
MEKGNRMGRRCHNYDTGGDRRRKGLRKGLRLGLVCREWG